MKLPTSFHLIILVAVTCWLSTCGNDNIQIPEPIVTTVPTETLKLIGTVVPTGTPEPIVHNCDLLTVESERSLLESERSLEFVKRWVTETYNVRSSQIGYDYVVTDPSDERLSWDTGENSYLARFDDGHLKHIVVGFPEDNRPTADFVLACLGSPEKYSAMDDPIWGPILIEVTLWYPNEGLIVRAFCSREDIQLPFLRPCSFIPLTTVVYNTG